MMHGPDTRAQLIAQSIKRSETVDVDAARPGVHRGDALLVCLAGLGARKLLGSVFYVEFGWLAHVLVMGDA